MAHHTKLSNPANEVTELQAFQKEIRIKAEAQIKLQIEQQTKMAQLRNQILAKTEKNLAGIPTKLSNARNRGRYQQEKSNFMANFDIEQCLSLRCF